MEASGPTEVSSLVSAPRKRVVPSSSSGGGASWGRESVSNSWPGKREYSKQKLLRALRVPWGEGHSVGMEVGTGVASMFVTSWGQFEIWVGGRDHSRGERNGRGRSCNKASWSSRLLNNSMGEILKGGRVEMKNLEEGW